MATRCITIDFETRSAADLIKWGQRRYALDGSTQALCLCWQFPEDQIDGPVHLWHRNHPWIDKSPRPDELIDRIRDGEPVEAHNAGFEFNIWNECFTLEFPEFDVKIKPEQLYCSAAKASCLSLPRSLDGAIEALGLPHRKIADGKRLINKLSKPMARRRGAKIDGEVLQTAFAKEIYLRWDPGTVITNEHCYAIIEEMAADYPSTAAPRAAARVVLQRIRDKGYLESLADGAWIFTDKKPPQSALGVAALITPPPVIVFCEEEAEHRKNWKYCAGDVRAERGLSDFCPEMTARERDYWLMDLRMNLRGIALDHAGAEAALEMAAMEAARLNGELSDLTGGAVQKGSQRAALLAWANGRLAEVGGEPLANTKADTLSFALDGVPTKAGDEAREAAKEPSREKWEGFGQEGENVNRALRICMEVNRSSVAKYKRMVQSVCPDDDRLHDIMLYNGADRTGRWSGKGVQPHNFVRGYAKTMPVAWEDIMGGDTDLITLVWEDPMVALAKACRGALIASPGKEIYAADFNAIEARKLAWLSGCAAMLAKFTPGQDIYCDMATGIYGRTITKADKSERNLGKKAILGLGYAMGWEKFQATVWNDEGIWLEDEFCQMVVKVYRKDKYPEVPQLWRDSEKAAIAAVLDPGGEYYCGGDAFGIGAVSYFMQGRFLHCRLPSGRLLAYLDPQVRQRVTYRFAALNARGRPTTVNFPAKKSVPQHRVRWHAEKLAMKQNKRLLSDPPESFISPHLSFMGRDTYTKQWKRCGTHGGSLVENYDQASSRDLLAEAMYRIGEEDKRFDLLLSIHDEVIAEAPIRTCTLQDFEAEMAIVPDWAPGMPITAEGWIGQRLRK